MIPDRFFQGARLLSATTKRRPVPRDFLLSVIVPVYNERETVRLILERVASAPYRKQVVVVDDGSSDGTRELLQELVDGSELVHELVVHEKNRGKGAALRSGFETAKGDIVIIQDADLEYDPVEYPKLLAPILEGRADVVYGSRFLTGMAHRVLFFWHSVANRFLTLVSNMLTNLNLTDMETCYKVFRVEVVRNLELRENRFGVEPEITAKVARMKCRIFEVGISYDGRNYAEGKKISWPDAVWALLCILRYRVFYRPAPIRWEEAAPTEDPARAERGTKGRRSRNRGRGSRRADVIPAQES